MLKQESGIETWVDAANYIECYPLCLRKKVYESSSPISSSSVELFQRLITRIGVFAFKDSTIVPAVVDVTVRRIL